MSVNKNLVGTWLTDSESGKIDALTTLSGFSKTFVCSTLVRIGLKNINTKENGPFKAQMIQLLAEAEVKEMADSESQSLKSELEVNR